MRASSKLIQVYVELRSALGDAISAGEVLALAQRLVEAADHREVIDRCGTAIDDLWGCVPLDQAIRDGGWALYCEHWSPETYGDDALDRSWQPRTRPAAHFQGEIFA